MPVETEEQLFAKIYQFPHSNQFEKNLRIIYKNRGSNLNELVCLWKLMDELSSNPQARAYEWARNRPHKLKGPYNNCFDVGLSVPYDDWVIIYTLNSNNINFLRTGTHKDLELYP